MEALKQTYDQFRKVWLSLSSGQRGTLIVVPLIVAGAIFFLARASSGSSYVPLSLGKAFTAKEMEEATRTLSSAGLNDFRANGQQILVPGDQVATYNAALVAGGGLPSGWASEWERKFDKQSGVFTSAEHLQNIKEIQLAKALREMIITVPDVEDASVIWTPATKRSWRRDSNRTATVSVKARPGCELSMNLVQGIRHSVAGAIDDLKPENVVVFDQVKMTAFTPERDNEPNSGRLLNQIKEFTSHYQQKISKQLRFIPDVIVTVDVEMERANAFDKTSMRDGASFNDAVPIGTVNAHVIRTAEEAPLESGMPKSVQVSVFIPNDYFRAVAAEQVRATGIIEGSTDSDKRAYQKAINTRLAMVEEQVKSDVKETVARSIPKQASSDAVIVSSYVAGTPETVKAEAPGEAIDIIGLLRRWGGLIGFALVALVGLGMLSRRNPRPVEKDNSDDEEAALLAQHLAEIPAMPKPIALPSRRNELQSAVRDNPEMASAVLEQWLRGEN